MPRRRITPGKAVARLALALVVPALFLLAAEAVLRGLDMGYPTGFLLPGRGGKGTVVNNPFYGYRFFPHGLARSPPPLVCDRAKPDGLVRVVVLGESAAMGDPVMQFSAPRLLEKMLNYAEGAHRFEVVNTAMTAVDSSVIADIASELDRLNPDVVILYIGNNEVVGPYGPVTPLTLPGWSWLTPWRVRLSRLRLTQVLRAAWEVPGGGAGARRHFGMELFETGRLRADDPRLEPMYALYANRMEHIIDCGQSAGAEVLLCTIAVNLTDCAPFGSDHRLGLDLPSCRAWNAAYAEGRRAQQALRYDEALRHYETAAAIDDRYAELAYGRAQVLAASGRAGDAETLFALARDLDTLRFRADSRINRTIRGIAGRRAVTLVDVEDAFSRAPNPARLFLDHVHFTFEGAYGLAGEWFTTLARCCPDLVMPPPEICRERMFFTPWSERHQAMVMYERRSHPPFARQTGNERRKEDLAAVVQRCNAAIETNDVEHLRALYEENVARCPEDVFYPIQWATILMMTGKAAEALAVLTNEVQRMPHHFEWRIMPAYLLARQGDPGRAAALLLEGGPPYGWYLADHTDGVMSSLEADGLRAEAHRLGQVVLEGRSRFPGREWLAGRMARLERQE
ncbi:MAG: tetratricopeptide repeat protein [Kiritimatiellae bacterium]|nr:tetratricopeptide repeat protein [Kiritimatiellia bacterium]